MQVEKVKVRVAILRAQPTGQLPIRLRARYAISGTEIPRVRTRTRRGVGPGRYAMSGTDLGHAATSRLRRGSQVHQGSHRQLVGSYGFARLCPVLTSYMLLPGHWQARARARVG
eukprot:1993167-Rhodomonas_salina.9